MKTHEEKPDGREAYLLYGGSHCASAPAGGFPRSPAYDSGGLVSNALLFPLYMSEDCPLYARRTYRVRASHTMVLTVHHLANSRSQRILWLLVSAQEARSERD